MSFIKKFKSIKILILFKSVNNVYNWGNVGLLF